MASRPQSPHSHGRSEFKDRGSVAAAVAAELMRLGSSLRAMRQERGMTIERAAGVAGVHGNYLQRVESGRANPTVSVLVALAQAYRIPVSALFELAEHADEQRAFRRLRFKEVRPFDNALPLFPLVVAAGAFGTESPAGVAPEAWVEPLGRTRPGPGLFVARVTGQSMNRRIPPGAYCVFASPVVGSRQGRIVIACHRDIQDPEHGGQYTVKRYESSKRHERSGSWTHTEVRLIPESDDPRFEPLVFRGLPEGELSIVAELVEVLPV